MDWVMFILHNDNTLLTAADRSHPLNAAGNILAVRSVDCNWRHFVLSCWSSSLHWWQTWGHIVS